IKDPNDPQYLALMQRLDRMPGPSRWADWTEPDRARGVNTRIGRVVLAAPETFLRIGHSLIGLVGAVAGGWVGRRLFDRRSDRRTEAAVKAAGILLKVLEAGL